MNKLAVVIISAVVVVCGAAFWLTHSSSQQVKVTTKTDQNDTETAKYGTVDACNVLTEAVASQILGAAPTKGDTAGGNISTASLSASTCTYYYKPAATAAQQQDTHTVSLLVQSANNATGASQNQAQFAQLPSGSQWVAGYGAKSYWTPKSGQLNVLYNNNWYIVSDYSGTSPTAGRLDQAQQLADALQGNLQ